MSEWQDISTAPKDETTIDVWVVEDCIAYRKPDVWWHPEGGPDKAGCWWDSDADYGDGGPLVGTVTHWMPTPKAPS